LGTKFSTQNSLQSSLPDTDITLPNCPDTSRFVLENYVIRSSRPEHYSLLMEGMLA